MMSLLSTLFDGKIKLEIENVKFERTIQKELLKNVVNIKTNSNRIYKNWWSSNTTIANYCKSKLDSNKNSVSNCPLNHGLILTKNDDNIPSICDNCNKEIFIESYRCEFCNFDICNDCYLCESDKKIFYPLESSTT